MKSIENKVLNRIYGHGRGWSFSKKDFTDLANENTIDKSLSRLLTKGKIRRVTRGVYDYPGYSKLLDKELPPDIDQLAQALARKHGWDIQISGNAALNILGLSTQVPTKYLYYTDGRSKTYKIGKATLEFKKSTLKDIGMKYPGSALLVQAIKSIGKRELTQEEKQQIRSYFSSDKQKKRILKDTKYTTSWVYETIKSIFRDD